MYLVVGQKNKAVSRLLPDTGKSFYEAVVLTLFWKPFYFVLPPVAEAAEQVPLLGNTEMKPPAVSHGCLLAYISAMALSSPRGRPLNAPAAFIQPCLPLDRAAAAPRPWLGA
jgi:hypothetical protein